VATPVAVPAPPQTPAPGASLPPVVRDPVGTVGRTTDAVLAPVGRTVRRAGETVGTVAEPVVAPVREVAPGAGEAVDRVVGALAGG
jgi:hypothetical protein